MMRSVFISGTDTGVGKTMVCSCLAKFLTLKGLDVGIQKWVSTGNKDFSEDVGFCLGMIGKRIQEVQHPSFIAPYCFALPASPHLAAEVEGREVDLNMIKNTFDQLKNAHEVLIVEGVGGVMVPLTRKDLLIDTVAELGLPALIVSRNALGTINHTLLTIKALRTRNIEILGVIFNSIDEENEIIAQDNVKTIADMGQVDVLGVLPKADVQQVFSVFQPIGERILQRMRGGCQLPKIK